MQSEPEPLPELLAASDAPIVLTGEPLEVALTPQQESPSQPPDGDNPRQILVSVEEIAAEGDPGLAYAVYLATPAGGHEHIGNVSLFGIGRQPPDQPMRQVFDATAALDTLRGSGVLDQNALRVTFEPILVSPPPGATSTPEDTPRQDVPPVRIGRVGMFAL